MNYSEKNKEIIKGLGLPYSDNLVMVPTSKNCVYPDIKKVCDLLTRNYLLATLATTEYNFDYFTFIYRNLNGMYKLDNTLDANDKTILEKLMNNEDGVDRTDLSWIYEECFVLTWMLGLTNFPKQEGENNTKVLDDLLFIQADEINQRNLPSKLFTLLYNKETKSFDYSKLNLKSFDEILEKADLIKRYEWALEELQINNQENKSGLNNIVLHYQLEAFRKVLNWDLTNPGK